MVRLFRPTLFCSCSVAEPFGEWFPEGLVEPAVVWLWPFLGCICLVAPYFAFQKHWLPHTAGKWVGRIYFWPCIPCSVYGNKKEFKGKWYCTVEEGVLLGQASP